MADKLQVRHIDYLTPVTETLEILTTFLLLVLAELTGLLDCSISLSRRYVVGNAGYAHIPPSKRVFVSKEGTYFLHRPAGR
jgi:hypothetical protein